MDTLRLSREVFIMPRSRPPYSPEFRRPMVDLVRAGRSPDDLAREFEPTLHSIRAWVALADRSEGRREEAVPGLATAERDELAWPPIGVPPSGRMVMAPTTKSYERVARLAERAATRGSVVLVVGDHVPGAPPASNADATSTSATLPRVSTP